MLHKQLTVAGSWVYGLWELQALNDFLVRHELHPEAMITHRFPFEQVKDAFELFSSRKCGEVMITWP